MMRNEKTITRSNQLPLPSYGMLLYSVWPTGDQNSQGGDGPIKRARGGQKGSNQRIVAKVVTQTGFLGEYVKRRILVFNDFDLWTGLPDIGKAGGKA